MTSASGSWAALRGRLTDASRIRPRRRAGRRSDPRVLFAVTGGSGASPGMGSELYRTQPVFRDSVDACGRVVAEHVELDFDLADSFRQPSDATTLTRPDQFNYRSPNEPAREAEHFKRGRRHELVALGTLQIACCDLWRSLGVRPSATLGISLGEVAAAYAAGALSREEAATVVCAVANAVSDATIEGFMFTLGVDGRTARSLCAEAPGQLEFLGTLDRLTSVVLTTLDDGPAIRGFLARAAPIESESQTPWSYHTVRGVCDRQVMEDALLGVSAKPPSCPVYSAAAGRGLDGARFDAAHWHWAVSRPFFYEDAVAAALGQGIDVVISIGAHPEQKRAIVSAAERLGRLSFIDSMRRNEPELAVWERGVTTARQLGVVGRSPTAAVPGFAVLNGARPRARPRSTAATLILDDPGTAQDPFAHYEDLRRYGSVHHLSHDGSWLVLGHAEVLAAFSRPQLFSSRLMASTDPVLLGADGPAHAVIRRALAALFSPPAVAPLTSDIDDRAATLLSPLADGHELDVVRDFAAPLASYVAARVLQLDDESATAVSAGVGDAEVETLALFQRIAAAMAPVIEHSGLATELREVYGFDEAQLRSVLHVMWIAATSTAKRVVVSSIRMLAQDPELRRQLLAAPALIDAFVEESIRLHPPELLIGRVTTAPVRLGEAEIPEGSVVQLCIGAANRDPARFVDPGEVRLDRVDGHLAFGSGAHACPGAGLARAEVRSALSALLQISPDFEAIQPPCMLRYITAATTHGLEQLVIGPARPSSVGSPP